MEKKNVKDVERVSEQIKDRSKELGGNYRINDVRWVSKIPVSSIGKVQRYKLRTLQQKESVGEKKQEHLTEDTTFDKMKKILCSLGLKETISTDAVLGDDLGIDSLGLFYVWKSKRTLA